MGTVGEWVAVVAIVLVVLIGKNSAELRKECPGGQEHVQHKSCRISCGGRISIIFQTVKSGNNLKRKFRKALDDWLKRECTF